MPNIHVREALDANNFTVCFHIAIPATNNAVGMSWQNVLVNSNFNGKGASSILSVGKVGEITAAEKTSLDAGALYEEVRTLSLGGSIIEGTASVNAYLDSQFQAVKTEMLQKLQDKYQYFSYTRGAGG